MEESIVVNKGEHVIDLPPGFRFHPTDEEIITHYLTEKVMNSSFSACAIGEVDLNKCEPWDLPKKAKMGEKEWYFFCQRDRKYPTGMRTNRATEAGYWKATGKDKEIYKGKNCLVGMKKTLVFYRGRAPKGEKTNWVMHEYRLEGKFSYYNLPKAAKDEWVVCRVFHKSTGIKKTSIQELLRGNSIGDDFLDYSSLPPLMDTPLHSNRPSSSFNGDEDNYDYKTIKISSFDGNYLPHLSTSIINNNNNSNLQLQTQNPTYQTLQNSIFHPQISASNNPIFTFQTNPNMSGYFQNSSFDGTNQTLLRALAGQGKECKTEQYSSNQSMATLSQETGLSTDVNTTTEISSVVSKQEIGSSKVYHDDLDHQGPSSSVGPIADLEVLWDY
ncbi:hypothetical protein JCGZ_06867 [Jatropha curcas]|uniref:NAC transcription factor 003 n=1 Tax=Jatropha curcas TaxID=180498 RepID=R4NFR5_JATCU|nr:NAC domain-containing protein 87 [Jatropha curcas]AGL39659.1 NAC transcription factor 003 [Jatropha curcas]KDP20281.1 hypothetical protein JCGZ_06867 [Jatropha curcas]